jgi:hypothetical protein
LTFVREHKVLYIYKQYLLGLPLLVTSGISLKLKHIRMLERSRNKLHLCGLTYKHKLNNYLFYTTNRVILFFL